MFSGGIERNQYHKMGQSLNKNVFHVYLIPFFNKVAKNFLKVSNRLLKSKAASICLKVYTFPLHFLQTLKAQL